MAIFTDLIQTFGKGLDSNVDLIYLLDINLGGTVGTYSCASKSCDVAGTLYISKLNKISAVRRSIDVETGQFETADLSVSLSNTGLEFSKYPWSDSKLNKMAIFRAGFANNVTSNDLSVGTLFTLYKGIIKREERGNKQFSLSIGDYTNKIFRSIPPRILNVTEFPFVGTSVVVNGTKVDADTSLVGKRIPYIYGDFSASPYIKPLFIDTQKKRYLIADHAIGTISSVYSNGTRVYNFTHPNIGGYVAGTHIMGTNIMSFISFGTSQGTKTVFVAIKGRYDSTNTLIENPALILKDVLLSNNICDLSTDDINTTSFDTTETWLDPYRYRYVMDGELHKDSMEFIQELCVDTLSNFWFDKDNMASIDTYRPAISRTSIKSIAQTDILEDTFITSRDVRDVYNKVVVNYDYDWVKKEYRNAYETGGTTYISKYDTVKTFELDAPFVYTQAEASYAGKRWLSRLQKGLGKTNFSIPITKIALDVSDRIHVTHDEPPTGTIGWVNRLLNITEFEIDNENKNINISGIDEDEINLGMKYFILGNGTAFYRSASIAQRYYGALCGASGTFTNADTGYILW